MNPHSSTILRKSLRASAGRRKSSARKGFALVVTILMMVLLVIIAVGLLSLSTVSIRQSGLNDANEQARANARMALMIAIGELQRQMGPDQRISMTADQQQQTSGDGSETSSASGNRHWTGVYDSWPETSLTRPNPSDNFRGWLISGDRSLITQERAPESQLSATDSVELVGIGTLGENADQDRVLAPVVDVKEGTKTKGRYAWWVGDQGVKAAISTPLPPTDNALANLRNSMQSAPFSTIQLATTDSAGSEIKPFGSLAQGDARFPKVISWETAEFLASGVTHAKPLFHDLAPRSTGLLTNVRKGGFRKDLSMMMENFTAPPSLTDPENVLYTVRNNAINRDEVGINFMELWAYYHLYKQLEYGNNRTYVTSGSISPNVPLLKTKDSVAAIAADNWDMFKHPIVLHREILVSFEVYSYNEYDQPPLAPGAMPTPRVIPHALFINFDPVITLWNPLDVPVHVQSFRPVNTPRNAGYLCGFGSIPYDLKVSVNGTDFTCPLSGSTSAPLSLDVGRVEATNNVHPIVMKPGEVVMFSQAGSTGSGSNRLQVERWNAGFGELRLLGKEGFNFGGGMSVALRDNSNNVRLYTARWPNPAPPAVPPSSPPVAVTTGKPIELQPSDTITYSLTPNSTRDQYGLYQTNILIGEPWDGNRPYTAIAGTYIDHIKSHSRAQVGDTLTMRNASRNLGLRANDRKADPDLDYSDLFPNIEGADTKEIPVAQLIGRKEPFMSYGFRIKTELENDLGTKMMARFNPKAHFTGFYDLSKGERDMLPYELEVKPVTSFNASGIEVKPDGESYFGSSLAGGSGSSFVVTHSVPRQPIVSLAAFQHSFANGFNRLPASEQSLQGQPNKREWLARFPLLPQISHAIGNSLAPSVIPPDQTEVVASNTGYPHSLADHSYLANRELWDDYFLSGITPQPTPAFATARDQRTVALDFFKGEKSLPVVRYLPVVPSSSDSYESSATELAESLFSGGIPTEESILKVARHLLVDGMFNVNSTSKEAWKAQLGSLRNRPIVVRDALGVESIEDADGNTPVANIHAPGDTLLEDSGTLQNDANWNGRRALTDDEIDALAGAIVKEVRKRGPFLSLADFVNRRVGTNTDLARAGAIQNALDSEDVPINKEQNERRGVDASVANRFEFPEAEEGAMNYGAPSYVKQADILTPIAPILSARSDSFVIRAYGESLDEAGKVVARAWCEAVVERSHDYVDPADNADALPDALNQVNLEFGRRFQIVSFRWLTPSEI